MALQFTPPPDWLIQNYVNRPSPGQEVSDAIGSGLNGYVQAKAMQQSQQNAALKQYIDAFSAGGPALAGQVAQRNGLKNPPSLPGTTAAQVAAGGVAGVSYPPTPGDQYAPKNIPPTPPIGKNPNDEQATPAPDLQSAAALPDNTQAAPAPATAATPAAAPAPTLSPIVQASLAAGHPNHSGLTLPGNPDPLALAGMGKYGSDQLGTLEKVQKITDAQAAAKDKSEENGPKSFDYARAFAANAKAPNAADAFIDLAKKEGRDTLTKREMSDLKDSINVSAQQGRGEFYKGSLSLKEQQVRDSMNKEARTVLDPYFQTGEGKKQASRLTAIGRAQALAQQVDNQPGGADSRQMTELATSVATLLATGGATAQAQIEHLIPQTYKGKANQFIESLTNNPTGLEQQAFAHRYVETLGREANTIKSQVRQTAERSASTLRVLKDNYPEDYNAIMDQYMNKSPEIMGPSPAATQPPPNGHQTIVQNGNTYTWNGASYE